MEKYNDYEFIGIEFLVDTIRISRLNKNNTCNIDSNEIKIYSNIIINENDKILYLTKKYDTSCLMEYAAKKTIPEIYDSDNEIGQKYSLYLYKIKDMISKEYDPKKIFFVISSYDDNIAHVCKLACEKIKIPMLYLPIYISKTVQFILLLHNDVNKNNSFIYYNYKYFQYWTFTQFNISKYIINYNNELLYEKKFNKYYIYFVMIKKFLLMYLIARIKKINNDDTEIKEDEIYDVNIKYEYTGKVENKKDADDKEEVNNINNNIINNIREIDCKKFNSYIDFNNDINKIMTYNNTLKHNLWPLIIKHFLKLKNENYCIYTSKDEEEATDTRYPFKEFTINYKQEFQEYRKELEPSLDLIFIKKDNRCSLNNDIFKNKCKNGSSLIINDLSECDDVIFDLNNYGGDVKYNCKTLEFYLPMTVSDMIFYNDKYISDIYIEHDIQPNTYRIICDNKSYEFPSKTDTTISNELNLNYQLPNTINNFEIVDTNTKRKFIVENLSELNNKKIIAMTAPLYADGISGHIPYNQICNLQIESLDELQYIVVQSEDGTVKRITLKEQIQTNFKILKYEDYQKIENDNDFIDLIENINLAIKSFNSELNNVLECNKDDLKKLGNDIYEPIHLICLLIDYYQENFKDKYETFLDSFKKYMKDRPKDMDNLNKYIKLNREKINKEELKIVSEILSIDTA